MKLSLFQAASPFVLSFSLAYFYVFVFVYIAPCLPPCVISSGIHRSLPLMVSLPLSLSFPLISCCVSLLRSSLSAPPPTLMICSFVFHTHPVLFAAVLLCSARHCAVLTFKRALCSLARTANPPQKNPYQVIVYVSLAYLFPLTRHRPGVCSVQFLCTSVRALCFACSALLCFAIAAGSLVDVRSFVCLYHSSLPPGRRRS